MIGEYGRSRPPSTTPVTHIDTVADPSWKLALLLQLEPGALVLVDGQNVDRLSEGLNRLGFRVRTLSTAQPEDIGAARALVALPDATVGPGTIFRVARAMPHSSQVLAFFKNRLNAFGGARAALRHSVSTRTCGMTRARSSLSRSDSASQIWLPLPKHSNAEEYVAADERAEIAASLALTKQASRWRTLLHDGFGIYVSAPGSGLSSLAHRIAEAMNEDVDPAGSRITRFDLRERGALVLFLTQTERSRSFVCRIVDESAAKHLQRHWDLQNAVRAATHASRIQALIPRPVATVELDSHRCWIEERLPGTISWRLPATLRSRLDAQMIDFLHELGTSAGVYREIEELDIRREAQIWSDQVGGRLSGEVHHLFVQAIEELTGRFCRRKALFTWIHGDYGYGNVLASASDGLVTAVIDWETAVPDGFCGIDLFNFLLQRYRADGSRRLSDAMALLIRGVVEGTLHSEIPGVGIYLDRHLPDKHLQMSILGVTLCRWVRREHRYVLSRAVDTPELSDCLRQWLSASACHR